MKGGSADCSHNVMEGMQLLLEQRVGAQQGSDTGEGVVALEKGPRVTVHNTYWYK